MAYQVPGHLAALLMLAAGVIWVGHTLAGMYFRRCFGGYLGIRRPVLFALSPLLALPWMFVPDMSLAHRLLVVLMLSLNWADGHKWERPELMVLRYTWMPALVALLLVGNVHMEFDTWAAHDSRAVSSVLWITLAPDWRWTPIFWIGPYIALGYWVVQRPLVADFINTKWKGWTPSFPKTNTTGIDGPIAVAELFAGGITYGVANGLALVLIVRDILA